MLGSKTVKQYASALGADLCGIAAAADFHAAPDGFQPGDIYPDCRAVIVFAKQVPSSTLAAANALLYSHVHDVMTSEVDRIAVELCIRLEDHGIGAVPIPSDEAYPPGAPGEASWGIFSLRHAGHLAGLGVLGKNGLLINRKFGSMIHLGAVLIDTDLEADSPASYNVCRLPCRACLDACPQLALDGLGVRAELCRELSLAVTAQGRKLTRCMRCRQVCPSNLGL